VNTNHVRPGELGSAKDLLNPKWTGKIVIRDPTSASGGAGDAARFYTEFGEPFVRALYVDQKPVISRDSRQIADWLAHGKYAIAIGAAMEEIQLLRKEGFPVAIIHRLSDIMPATTSSAGLVGIANKAPHPSAARLFVNWVTSREGVEAFGKASGYPTTRKDIDELAYAPAELIPPSGVETFDAGSWDFAQVKEKIRLRMAEILKR
jgi:iron(III) transport system substrate-binding protein